MSHDHYYNDCTMLLFTIFTRIDAITCQVLACLPEDKNIGNFCCLSLSAAVAYKRCLSTRASNYRELTEKILVFWKRGHLWKGSLARDSHTGRFNCIACKLLIVLCY